MFLVRLFLCCSTLHMGCSDWVSEWMSPVQEQLNGNPLPSLKSASNTGLEFFGKDITMGQTSNGSPEGILQKDIELKPSKDLDMEKLKIKIESTLENAKILAENLKVQIASLVVRENLLKEAITNGRTGTTTLTVSTTSQLPRSYILRDGRWTLCNGMIQTPATAEAPNAFQGIFSMPRCIGKEIETTPDPCVFNSVIKYETVPVRRMLEYSEEDYLCLKPSFNKTLERYMSVASRVMNETCTQGTLRSLEEINVECGIRMMTEYSFYPYKISAAATLPLEYCVEKDGSCKLIVAWHITNATVENFEFLKNEHNFKNFFIKSGPVIEHVI